MLLPSPLQIVNHPLALKHKIKLFIKRDDLIHNQISGNKWRKLKYNIEKFRQKKYNSILTFGGAYSNHIAATAAVGSLLSIPTIGIIRGDELTIQSNKTLLQAHKNKMKLEFVTRSKYAERYERIYHEELRTKYGNTLIINEGGANFHGVLGCIEIMNEIYNHNQIKSPNYIYTASGTGTTAAGLLLGSKQTKVVSVPVFKKGEFIKNEVTELLNLFQLSNNEILQKMKLLELNVTHHFGGYGKFTNELIKFINDFYFQTNIKLDQIYTAKMMYSLMSDIEQGKHKPNSTIIALHTGGLQGLLSIKNQLIFSLE